MSGRDPTPGEAPRLERWSDWLNPLLVREVRQALRGRVFSGIIVLTALISAAVLVCGILAMSKGRPGDTGGMAIYAILYYLLWALCCVLLPVSAAARFRNERSSGEFELFLITGISARQVVSGKLQAALVQVLLALATAAPFLMACHVLRGISALHIALSLLCLALFTVVLTQGGILLGALTSSKVFFGLLMLPFVWLLMASFTMAGGLLMGDGILELFGTSDAYLGLLAALAALIHYFLLFHFGAVAMLEPESRNRSFPLRLLLLVAAVVVPALLLFVSDLDNQDWLFYLLFLPPAVAATLLAPISAQPVATPIRQRWGKGWRRWLRPLFHPDRGSVLVWLALFLGMLTAWETALDDDYFLSSLCAVLLFWAMLGNLLGRIIAPRAPTLLLSIIGNGVPAILATFLYFANEEEAAQMLLPVTTGQAIRDLSLDGAMPLALAAIWAMTLAYGLWRHVQENAKPASGG